MVRWSDGRGWWQRWSDGQRLCSDRHRSWVTNLLVKGCESNLVLAGWWVVGLGFNGSWCNRSMWWFFFCGGLLWWVCVCVFCLVVRMAMMDWDVDFCLSFFSLIWVLWLSSFFSLIWVLWLWLWLFCDLKEEGSGWTLFFFFFLVVYFGCHSGG